MQLPSSWPVLNEGDDYWRLVNSLGVNNTTELKVAFVVQGGGARGAWQGGLLNTLLDAKKIVPVATMGSSAGAINSVLLSTKLKDRSSDPFAPAWKRLRSFVRKNVLRLFWGLLLHAMPHRRRGDRRAHQFPNRLLVNALMTAFSEWECRLYTYIQACDVNASLPAHPATLLYALEAHPSNQAFATNHSRNRTAPLRSVPTAEAVAASACLPTISPLCVDGKLLMDGGIMSNLPLEFTSSSPNIGAHLVLLVLPQKLSNLSPKTSFVDWNVLSALQGLQSKLTADSPFVYCVIEPDNRLASGLVRGFICPLLQSVDAAAGACVAKNFLDDISEFFRDPRKNTQQFRRYDLRHRQLPQLPPNPPVEKWMDYANWSWRTSYVGTSA